MKRGLAVVLAALFVLAARCSNSGDGGGRKPPCDLPAAYCSVQERISAANDYLRTRPGQVGYVLRVGMFVYRSEFADQLVWTASTIKLAMAADLLMKNRAGTIKLTASDRELIQKMLHSSDDDAADALWEKYAGKDKQQFNRDFVAFGMTGLEPEISFSSGKPYWGFQKCTPDDLDHLMQYVLTQLDPTDRAYIVDEMQNVAPDQQWGVWAAGPDQHPGNKDGWSEEEGGWVINSVGFAGPDQQYTLAIMNALQGKGGYDEGVETISHVAKVLLAGL
ncbi:MAG: tat pathway signal sequence [Nocardiaceae bacterium]|nr:tat pathway signal sequence [Nocardiaceae bacterium]